MTPREYYLAHREESIERSKAYYHANKKRCLEMKTAWVKSNPDKVRAIRAKSLLKNADRRKEYHRSYGKEYNRHPEVLARHRAWKKANRAHMNAYFAKRPIMDRVYASLRQRVRKILHCPANGSRFKFIGCTAEFLRDHLEKQFRPGMTWDTWGVTGWHIDHVKPLTAFDLTNPEQKSIACHWSNLQPLWYWENIAKGDKAA